MKQGLLKQTSLCTLGLGAFILPSIVTIQKSRESLSIAEETDRVLKQKTQERQKLVYGLDAEVNKYRTLAKKESDRAHSEGWHKENLKRYSGQLKEKLKNEKESHQKQLKALEERNEQLKKSNWNLNVELVKAMNHPSLLGKK